MTPLDAAKEYLGAGLGVLPIRADGSKAPHITKWEPLKSKRLETDEAERLFFGDVGVGIICGAVSGGLEVLDFDKLGLFDDWCELVNELHPGLLQRLPVVETPTGCAHVYLRSGYCGGNEKLARSKTAVDDRRGTVLIEVKGEGGYVIAPPSNGGVHPSGNPYIHLYGPGIVDVPFINQEERKALFDAARSFNEVAREAKTEPPKAKVDQGRPGDEFEKLVSWDEILTHHDWTKVYSRDETDFWRRPGKSHGISATTNYMGSDCLYVFSSNAAPFEEERTYTKFGAYAMLNCGGDWSSAARELREAGYGKEPENVEPPTSDKVEPFPVKYYPGEPSQPEWVFEGLIEKGTCTLVSAEPKAGKSWVTFDMGVCLASNQKFLGKWGPTEPGKALFYSPEGGDRSRHARIRGLCSGHELDYDQIWPQLPFLDADLNLTAVDHAARLGATIDEIGATLVVIDPLVSAAMGIDENSAGDVMGVLTPLRNMIKARPHCALVLVHHTGKGAKGSSVAMGIRGSSAINGWWDTHVCIRHNSDNACDPRRVDIFHRDFLSPDPLGFELNYDDDEDRPGHKWFRLVGCEPPDLSSSGRPGPKKDDSLVRKIVATVAGSPGMYSRYGLAGKLGVTKPKLNRYVSPLIDDGSLSLNSEGKLILGGNGNG